VDDFVSMLTILPAEPSIIADSVYSATQLMDGRRFAEEFLRRRKLADKGVVESASTGLGFETGKSAASGGWSEVAKKGPPKEPEVASGFRVVPGKKKGKK
jgi:PERQ amino acid-rich with GYF domain-containing protein